MYFTVTVRASVRRRSWLSREPQGGGPGFQTEEAEDPLAISVGSGRIDHIDGDIDRAFIGFPRLNCKTNLKRVYEYQIYLKLTPKWTAWTPAA